MYTGSRDCPVKQKKLVGGTMILESFLSYFQSQDFVKYHLNCNSSNWIIFNWLLFTTTHIKFWLMTRGQFLLGTDYMANLLQGCPTSKQMGATPQAVCSIRVLNSMIHRPSGAGAMEVLPPLFPTCMVNPLPLLSCVVWAQMALGKMVPWVHVYFSTSPQVSCASAGRDRSRWAGNVVQSGGEVEQHGAPGRQHCCYAGARWMD